MSAKKIALFIDADNISAKFGKQIIDTLESRGEIFIRRIYGNWEKISLHGWNECILNFSLRAVQQPDFAIDKNATDMSLTIDAMDVLYDSKADIFALVSNDSDFTPLAIRLRESGMFVIGMGNLHVSNSFRAACNEFIELDKIQTAISAPVAVSMSQKKHTLKKNSPSPLLPSTNAKVVSITSTKMSLQERFNMCGRNGLSHPKKKFQQIHNILSESAKIHRDSQGFSSLTYAGQDIKNKNLGFSIKDFGYNQLREFISDFPELYEIRQNKNGQQFRYRCR